MDSPQMGMNTPRTAREESGMVSAAKTPQRASIISLTDEAFGQLSKLSENLTQLEKVLSPIMDPSDIDRGESQSRPEPELSRPDVRVRVIIDELRKSNGKVNTLLRRVNI